MSKYIVSLKNDKNVKKNFIYRVIKERKNEIAIVDEMGKEYWIRKEDEGFKDFKILY